MYSNGESKVDANFARAKHRVENKNPSLADSLKKSNIIHVHLVSSVDNT